MAKSQKAHSSRKTKCPKGSRRNSKTGRCRKVKSVKSSKSPWILTVSLLNEFKGGSKYLIS